MQAIWSNPLLKQGQPEWVAQEHTHVAFEDLQGARLYHLSVQSVPVLCHLHSTEVLPDVHMGPPVLPFVLMASCPGTGRH